MAEKKESRKFIVIKTFNEKITAKLHKSTLVLHAVIGEAFRNAKNYEDYINAKNSLKVYEIVYDKANEKKDEFLIEV